MSYYGPNHELPDDHIREIEPSDELLLAARDELGPEASDDDVFERACEMAEDEERDVIEDMRAAYAERD